MTIPHASPKPGSMKVLFDNIARMACANAQRPQKICTKNFLEKFPILTMIGTDSDSQRPGQAGASSRSLEDFMAKVLTLPCS